jgi:hypothetical protein
MTASMTDFRYLACRSSRAERPRQPVIDRPDARRRPGRTLAIGAAGATNAKSCGADLALGDNRRAASLPSRGATDAIAEAVEERREALLPPGSTISILGGQLGRMLASQRAKTGSRHTSIPTRPKHQPSMSAKVRSEATTMRMR